MKVKVAWVEIYHPMSDTVISTVKEECSSEAEAVEQFQNLNKLISSWTTPNDGIVLLTTNGWIRLPSDFIGSSILKLHIETIDSFEDEVQDNDSNPGE